MAAPAPSAPPVMERNEMQMIEVLMARLKNLESKVGERRKACVEDRNSDSNFCSSLVAGLQTDMGDDEDGGDNLGKARHSVFRPRSKESSRPHTHGRQSLTSNEVFVTFRSAAPTDFGKKLEHKFDLEELGKRPLSRGGTGSGGAGPGGGGGPGEGLTVALSGEEGGLQHGQSFVEGGGHGGSKKVNKGESKVGSRFREGQRKLDEQQAERAKYEKRLLENLETYITRSVTDQWYSVPAGAVLTQGGARSTAPFVPPPGTSVPRKALDEGHGVLEMPASPAAPTHAKHGGGGHGKRGGPRGHEGDTFDDEPGSTDPLLDLLSPDAKAVAQDAAELDAEHWPIPVSPTEFNPRLLLALACEKMVLPGGAKLFRHFALSQKSCWLFIYLFWFCHCKHFQPDSLAEQEHLLKRVAGIYVQLLATPALGPNKDFFFRAYPFLLGNAIVGAFHYTCPGSRHLYTRTLKRMIYLTCSQVVGGVASVNPASVLVERDRLFPDEAVEDQRAATKVAVQKAIALANPGPSAPQPPNAQPVNAAPPKAGGGSRPGSRGGSKTPVVGAPSPAAVFDLLGDALPALPQANHVKAMAAGGAGSSTARSQPTLGARGVGGVAQDDGDGGVVAGRAGRSSNASLGLSVSTDPTDPVGAGFGDGPRRVGFGGGDGGGGDEGPMGEAHWRKVRERSLAPLQALGGDRAALLFRPGVPGNLDRPLPRQHRDVFDNAGISPMVQQYLEHPEPFIKPGRRPERMGRTAPVRWCPVGGVETFRRSENRKDVHDSIAAQHAASLAAFREGDDQERADLKATLAVLEKQRRAVYSGGAISKGRYSLELVAEIAGRSNEGARKRQEKAKAAEKKREAEEKEAQAKIIADRKLGAA